MRKYVVTLAMALGLFLSVGVAAADAQRGTPPPTSREDAACAAVGLDNYVVRGDTLFCYDFIGRGSTWVELDYPVGPIGR
jgi:hypothetical protein